MDNESGCKAKALRTDREGIQAKALRTDRGGKFTSKGFHAFYESHGICRPLIAPRSSQQNSVTERKNITILNMARSMLKAKNMPKEFWVEDVSYIVCLPNRFSITSVKDKTP